MSYTINDTHFRRADALIDASLVHITTILRTAILTTLTTLPSRGWAIEGSTTCRTKAALGTGRPGWPRCLCRPRWRTCRTCRRYGTALAGLIGTAGKLAAIQIIERITDGGPPGGFGFERRPDMAPRKWFSRVARKVAGISYRADLRQHGRLVPDPVMRDGVRAWKRNHAGENIAVWRHLP